jgi:hypothetical protein
MTKGQRLSILLLIGVFTIAGAIIGGRSVLARSPQGQSLKALEAANVQKWEYRLVDANGNKDKAEAIANALGEQGFEMVNFSDSRYTYQFVFKRPKPQ